MNDKALRFGFGKNWLDYSGSITVEHIAQAKLRLSELMSNLEGKTFLEVGCGSGIHSLAAVLLGAQSVTSFDYDPRCVQCSLQLKEKYAPDANWRIERGSALDPAYLQSLGTFDVVYSWGVLHHTGDMWRAIENILVVAHSKLIISLYADQGIISDAWRTLKKAYTSYPISRRPIELLSLVTLWGPKVLLKPHRVRHDWKHYHEKRGMSPWHDIVDWAGGYPYEVARPENVVQFLNQRGFRLVKAICPGGAIRVNEFVFEDSRQAESLPRATRLLS
jgi:SAM-dependent methyltransferase